MTAPCKYCGTNGAHYCPSMLCGPDNDDLDLTDAECPECANDVHNEHLGTLGYRDYFRCRDCGWDWSTLNKARREAVYEDSCDQKRKYRTEEGF